MNDVDDSTLVEKLAHSGLIDIIISTMRTTLLNELVLSQEHETRLRETIYLKIKLLPDIKAAFWAALNKELEDVEGIEQGDDI